MNTMLIIELDDIQIGHLLKFILLKQYFGEIYSNFILEGISFKDLSNCFIHLISDIDRNNFLLV